MYLRHRKYWRTQVTNVNTPAKKVTIPMYCSLFVISRLKMSMQLC